MNQNLEEQEYIDFQQYLLILKRRWLPLAVVTFSIFGLAVAYTLQQKPTYEAEGKLRLDKNSGTSSLTGLGDKLGGLGELSGLTNLSNPLETEAQVITSNSVIEKTIADQNLKNNKGEKLKKEELLEKLNVKSIKGTDVMQISYKSISSKEAADTINTLINNYLENNVESNRAQAKAAKDFLQKQLPDVEKQVKQAEADIRKFKDKYEVVSLPDEAKVGVENIQILAQKITEVQSKIAGIKTRSQALQSKLNLTTKQAINLNTLSQTPAVQQLLAEYQKVKTQLATERSRLTEEHPTVINLNAKLEALRQQLQQQVGKTIDSNESIPEENLQLSQLKQNLTASLVETEVERLALDNELGVLNKSFLTYQNRLRGLPQLEQKQRELERKLQVAQITYQQLFKQLQEVEVLENQNIGNARVVSLATIPEKPISPKILLNLAGGGVLGVVLGVLVILGMELMDKSLKTVDEAKRLLGYPLLGTIPQLDKKNDGSKDNGATNNGTYHEDLLELPVLNEPYSPITSAFEILQTNLSFSLSDKTLKVIVISSSIPGEGKSFTSANLAVAISQLGKRVLLIDGDMRLPRQHKVWNVPNLKGLSNILVGQANFKNATQEVLVTLDILSAGSIPPNPLTLLESQVMANLIKEASQEYDFVIIDAPPLTAVADPLKLGQLADGMVLVVRPGVGTTESVSAAKELLKQSGQVVLGMVINGVNEQNSYGSYYYRDGYYGNRKKDENSSNISIS
jgi:polysaccharide biosynthesis transport protein